jgi:tetratricopeptide (TPR) repeat protein
LAEKHLKYRYYLTDPLLNLGRWHFLQGDYEQARQYYQDCLQLSKDINRPDTEATALLRLAEVAEAEGKEEKALKLARKAESVAGTEIRSVRDRAALLKERLLGKTRGLKST